jgi:hypothetical protein
MPSTGKTEQRSFDFSYNTKPVPAQNPYNNFFLFVKKESR